MSELFGHRRKPWHVEKAVKELHEKMQVSIGEWLEAFFKGVAPIVVYPHIVERDRIGLDWMKSEGYHWNHTKIRHISDTAFAMVFELYKGEESIKNKVNEFEFIVNHDGGFKEPHEIGAMIFVGATP